MSLYVSIVLFSALWVFDDDNPPAEGEVFLLEMGTTVGLVLAHAFASWLSTRIEQTVTQNSALETALYVESLIGERVQAAEDESSARSNIQSELERLVLRTPLGRRIVSQAGRHQFYTVRIVDGRAMPAFKASGDITSMSQADGYIEIPAQTDIVEKGEVVDVKLF